MAKRRRPGSQDPTAEYEDSPIGLTEAFAPVKGSQSVDYDADDSQIGLTQAFGPVVPDEQPAYGWNDENKWNDFDWNAMAESADAADGEPADEALSDTASQPPVHVTASQPPVTPAMAGAAGAAGNPPVGRGRHAAPDPEASPKMRKSRRTRRVLIVLIVLLLAVLGTLGFFGWRYFTESQEQAAQQTQDQAAAPKDAIEGSAAADAADKQGVVKADVPVLSQVIGLTQDEAVEVLKRGAKVVDSREAGEDEAPIKTNVTISLTEEPSDSRGTVTPTVYLGLDADGKVIQAGYSASASALGYGSVSFDDAVRNEHIIEKTLGMIGIYVEEGSAQLPADKDAYSTYASDGTTVMKEYCSFSGEGVVNDLPCTWSAVLSYDYTTQVLTGNLSDTVRIVYAYVAL